MNIIKCPECNSIDVMTYDTEGSIEAGRIIEEMECMNCDHTFTVKAELSKIKIEQKVE